MTEPAILHFVSQRDLFRPTAPNRVFYIDNFTWQHMNGPDFDAAPGWGVSCVSAHWLRGLDSSRQAVEHLEGYVDFFVEQSDLIQRGSGQRRELAPLAPSPSGVGLGLVVLHLLEPMAPEAALWAAREAAALGLKVVVVATYDQRDDLLAQAIWRQLCADLGPAVERLLTAAAPCECEPENHVFYAMWEANTVVAGLMAA